jgi:hypothetical protein
MRPWAAAENPFALASISISVNQMATLPAHINRMNNFCLLKEFQHISVMTDNLDRLEQRLENLNVAGNLGETSLSFLLSFFKVD